jgi:hypothetical protein
MHEIEIEFESDQIRTYRSIWIGVGVGAITYDSHDAWLLHADPIDLLLPGASWPPIYIYIYIYTRRLSLMTTCMHAQCTHDTYICTPNN